MRRKKARFPAMAGIVVACLAVVPGVAYAACANDAFRTGTAATLPDCRAYELVSPADKEGRDVVVDNSLFRISQNELNDPPAAMFPSLGGFGDARGSGVTFEYVAQRTLASGTQGWTTHAVTPLQRPTGYVSLLGSQGPTYVGDADPELTRLVFRAFTPLGPAPNTGQVDNLYLRSDLRAAGSGTYQLLTDAFAPVTPVSSPNITDLPNIAGTSTDLSHVLFESSYRLTADAPSNLSPKLYESVDGVVHLVGVLPASEGGGAAVRSIAGQGAGTAGGELTYTPHVLSADGSRAIFTVGSDDSQTSGKLYMRDDHGTASTADDTTVRINASERTPPDTPQPATYWDAASDGSRVFFTSPEALTNDAPVGGSNKLYVYNADLPASDPHNLTFVSSDEEPADAMGPVRGVLGVGSDGRTAFFIQSGQIVAGQPVLGDGVGIYAWHEGAGVRYVGQMVDDQRDPVEDTPTSTHFLSFPPWELGARVTPDGRFLLVSLHQPPWPGSFNQGTCDGNGCRELYLYDALSGGHPRCVSCGTAVPSTDALIATRFGQGAAGVTNHQNSPMLPDGSKVFFMTGESLVPQDVNGRYDVYEYDVASGIVHLVTSGQSTSDSYFLDVTPDGHDAYFATREQLSPWDVDQSMDVYDARVEGGVPAPPPTPPECIGDACQGGLSVAPAGLTASSSSLPAPPPIKVAPKHKRKPVRCRAPKVRRRVHGRLRCVTRAEARRLARQSRARGIRQPTHTHNRRGA